MNKKVTWILLGVIVVVAAVFFYLHSAPQQTENSSVVTTSSPNLNTPPSTQSIASEASVPFQTQNETTNLGIGTFNINTSTQGDVLALYQLSPTASSSVNINNPSPTDYLEYHWQGLRIVNGYRNSILSTSKQTINLPTFNVNFLTSVWTFAFDNNNYFLLSGSDCGTEACHAEYYMYLLDGQGNLTPIIGKSFGKSNFFWTVQSQGLGGYSTGNPEGVVAIQNKLYFVFLDQTGATTLIFDQDGAFDQAVNASNVFEYGFGKVDLDKIIPSWNLQ